jgi:hypothetical protein
MWKQRVLWLTHLGKRENVCMYMRYISQRSWETELLFYNISVILPSWIQIHVFNNWHSERTPCSAILPWNPRVDQEFRNFLIFYSTRGFLTFLTRAYQWSVPSTRKIQSKPVFYFTKIYINSILPSLSQFFWVVSFLQGFLPKHYAHANSSKSETFLVHLNPADLLIMTVLGKEYKFWRSSLYSFYSVLFNSSYIGSNIIKLKSESKAIHITGSGLWDFEYPTLSRQSAHRWRWGYQFYAQPVFYPPGRFLILISVRSWVNSSDFIGNRTRNFLACSTAPKLTAIPRSRNLT